MRNPQNGGTMRNLRILGFLAAAALTWSAWWPLTSLSFPVAG
jgi:hypothetical protein